MKNKTIAVRMTDSFRCDLDNAANELDVSISELVRMMILFCTSLNEDSTAYILRSNFLVYAERFIERRKIDI